MLCTLDFKQCILFLLIYDIQYNILEKFENNSNKKVTITSPGANIPISDETGSSNENNSDTKSLSNKVDTVSVISENTTTLMGYTLPTSTLYFIIVCIIIAIILFYMTSPVSKNSDDKKNKTTDEDFEDK